MLQSFDFPIAFGVVCIFIIGMACYSYIKERVQISKKNDTLLQRKANEIPIGKEHFVDEEQVRREIFLHHPQLLIALIAALAQFR
jgi:hypothetical protein